MALGGWMSGEIFDLTGSYQAAFLNGIAWNLLNISIASFLLLRSRRGMRAGDRLTRATRPHRTEQKFRIHSQVLFFPDRRRVCASRATGSSHSPRSRAIKCERGNVAANFKFPAGG